MRVKHFIETTDKLVVLINYIKTKKYNDVNANWTN